MHTTGRCHEEDKNSSRTKNVKLNCVVVVLEMKEADIFDMNVSVCRKVPSSLRRSLFTAVYFDVTSAG